MIGSKLNDLVSQIKELGLFCDRRGNIYGNEYGIHLRHQGGIWQYPEELAALCMFVENLNIKNFLNIGTFNGNTFNFLADYLNRKSKVRCVTLDLYNHLPNMSDNYEYYLGPSVLNFDRSPFEFVFIDGDHSYDGVKKDWESVRDTAKIIAFHDIADEFIENDPINQGGVKRLWKEIKAEGASTLEFVRGADSNFPSIMGIGVVIRFT